MFSSRDPSGNIVNTYYIKTISFLLVWSHRPSTGWTEGIIIPRISDSVHDRNGIFDSFAKTLLAHRDMVDRPWLLRFVAAVETCLWIDQILEHELGILRQSDLKTGHGCWESWNPRPRPKADYNDFAEISKILGFSAAALANVVRHIKLAAVLMDINPLENGAKSEHQEQGGTATSTVNDVSAALSLLRAQLDARKLDTEYLQERARNQLQVVFNLINQSDATASREIASAAKEDSTSMRVIALMTMIFLPGTFFAALFSMPSLQ